jgi:hypothetical protein
LSLLQLEARFLDRKKANFVDLREGLKFSGPNGPFRAEGVAGVIVSFGQITFARPGVNDLAAFLRNGAELKKRSGWDEANLLAKSTLRGQEQVLPSVRFTLGNGPVAIVFAGKERSARVRQENFRSAIAEPVQKQAG